MEFLLECGRVIIGKITKKDLLIFRVFDKS